VRREARKQEKQTDPFVEAVADRVRSAPWPVETTGVLLNAFLGRLQTAASTKRDPFSELRISELASSPQTYVALGSPKRRKPTVDEDG
jgi:hypothetical protein